MASQADFQNVMNRAVSDETFRAQLVEDPVAAVQEAGYDLTEEQIAQLENLGEEDVNNLLSGVEERISKSSSTMGVVGSWSPDTP